MADLIAVFGMQGGGKDLEPIFVVPQKIVIVYWLETQISHRVVDGTISHVHLLTLLLTVKDS